MIRLLRSLLLLVPALLPMPALAEETEPPAPWTMLGAQTAGTCSTDEISEDRACYMVRCEPRRGLVFVIQDGFLDDFDPRVVRLEIGATREVVRLEPAGHNERRVGLAGHPRLLAALRSKADWASMATVRAGTTYSTGFDLTGATALVGSVAATCRR